MMNKRITKILLASFVLVASITKTAFANEGMWLPIYIKQLEGKMKSMGSQLTAEDIYSVNNASIKDAIVSFGGYCTGEIVSSKGLIFTNHHCGYEEIAALSTVKNNYLKNGFWAANHNAELPVEGLSIKILVRMEDVTAKMKDATDKEATKQEIISAASSEGPGYTAEVKPMFYKNEYFLMVYQEFSDIRLVGTPPENIGKFGGDTDNWMWPRHTGDFSIFRIYANANNEPAAYSPNNVPYTPKKHLPISLGGVKEHDFSFILGFPGRTQRYLTSYQINKLIETDYPLNSSIMDVKLKTLKEFMDKDEAIKIQYASNYASYANTWKYFLANVHSASNSNFLEVKSKFEAELQSWINANSTRKEKWGTLLSDIEDIQKKKKEASNLSSHLNFGYFAPDFIIYGFEYFKLSNFLNNDKKLSEEARLVADEMKAGLDAHFESYNATVDKQVFINMVNLIFKNLPKEDIAKALQNEEFQKLKGNTNEEKLKSYADVLFSSSLLTNKSKAAKFLKKPSKKALSNDNGYKYLQSVLEVYFKVLASSGNYNAKEEALMTEYMAAIMEYTKKDLLYPDANFTLRFTFGEVIRFNSLEGKDMGFFTNATEILAKESTTNPEFEVFDRLRDLIKAKDYGRYAAKGEDLKVNFLTNHDITGGNSGSPVINANGALIGIAFDGNWDGMIGDLSFEPKLQRTINVDIRYVLFIIDKYAGATNIIDELTIVE